MKELSKKEKQRILSLHKSQLNESFDKELQYLVDNLDLLKVMKGGDGKILSDYIESLRQTGRYNMAVTDLSPYLTDPESILKSEFAREVLEWSTETNTFPIDYDMFFSEQEDPLPYLWDNREVVRDAMIRITLKFMDEKDLDQDMDNVNKVFRQLAKRVYSFILFGPHLKSAQSRNLNESKIRKIEEQIIDTSNITEDQKNPELKVGDKVFIYDYIGGPMTPDLTSLQYDEGLPSTLFGEVIKVIPEESIPGGSYRGGIKYVVKTSLGPVGLYQGDIIFGSITSGFIRQNGDKWIKLNK